MIQPIMHDPLFLAQKSAPATPEDAPVARDLLETLTAHADGCVGMAANMIGVLKRIIAVEAEDGYLVLFNPVILKKSGQYEAEEGCLSLEGVRKTKRYQSIKVQYQTMDGKLAHQDLYRLDGADHPARDRPLRWDLDLSLLPRTKPPRVCPPGALLCCNREMKVLLFVLKPLAVPCIRFDPWAGLASCRPLRQKFLPVSAAGGGRNFSL